jgi:hypothetical protein
VDNKYSSVKENSSDEASLQGVDNENSSDVLDKTVVTVTGYIDELSQAR